MKDRIIANSRKYYIKTLTWDSPEKASEAEREFRIHTQLSGKKGIITLCGKVADPDSIHLLLERGEMTLTHYLSTHRDEALDCAIQCAEALETVHANGYVHRDVKSGNFVMVGRKVKLIDFGSASNDPLELTSFTPAFAAPEYFRPEHNISAKADVWAFGCLLIEMFRGFDLEVDNSVLPWGVGRVESPTVTDSASSDSTGISSCGHYQLDEMRLFLNDPTRVIQLPDLEDVMLNQILQQTLEINPDNRPTMTEIKTALIGLKHH